MSALTDDRRTMRTSALLWAIALGVLADQLIREAGRPGVNVAIWALTGVSALAFLLRRRCEQESREARWLVGGALVCALALMLRDAEALAVFSMLAAVGLLMLAAGRATAAWITRAQVSDVALAVLRVVVLCAAGPIGWGRGESSTDPRMVGWVRRTRTLLRGVLMAAPALLLLSALLMSADPVFDRMIQDVFRIDLETLVSHLVFSAVIAWLTAGFLRAFMIDDDDAMDKVRLPTPALAAAEITVALWILNLLFIAFMAVQLRYLFGGANLVEVTAGLSYAEYARRGFFELVACAALVIPLLLVADWAASPEPPRTKYILRATMLVLVLLLLGVIASAAFRMKLYQDAYGLTEQRLLVSVVIVWLTVSLIWLVLTLLRDRREHFVFGSILAGLACLVALYAMNPHALITRVNLDRAATGAEYDGSYVSSLSADAVPTLISRLGELSVVERCRVTRMLEKRWTGERKGGWRSWNVSDWRARRLVAPLAGTLSCPGIEVPAIAR